MIYDSILDTIGRTPVVRINRLAPAGIDMFVKVEAFNPLGSVKDRLAIGIIEDAERRGPPPNPIHHPLFLPVLLVAFTLWFGFDGFLTTDPEMLEHQGFNRLMFVIMQPICLRAVPRGIREFLEDRQAEIAAQA